MARLQNPPKNAYPRDLPDHDKLDLAIQWLRENPIEKPLTAARIYNIKKEDTLRKRWNRDRKKRERGATLHGGQNKILTPEMHQSLIQYAVDQATGGGRGATKAMMYNATMWHAV
jgi:hypothetical protein